MKGTMIFIKILVLLIPYAGSILGIEVHENVTDDITTSTPKLVIVPTPIVKSNESVTTSTDLVEINTTPSMQNIMVTMNNSITVAPQTKSSRKKEKQSGEKGRNNSKVEQLEKTSSNVKHEKFVPSPEISLSGIEIQSQPAIPQVNDNFYPISQFHNPVKHSVPHSVHFHSSSPITSNANWRHTSNLDSLYQNYPKFEDEVQQHKENEKFTWPPTSKENGKWFFMPEQPRIETTEKPSRPSGKWKWVSDEEEQEKRILSSKLPSIPPNDFSYTFEIPSTDSTPFSFGSTKFEDIEQQSNIEGPSTTVDTVESEWDSPFTSSNALTPQVIYVDPNSTSSISPANSLALQSTPKYRSLNRGPILPEANELAEYENGRKFLSNPLMDFLHILRDNNNNVERMDSCDDRRFCEASRSGADPTASVLNKMLWKIANETPEFQAKKSGLEYIFQAIRSNNCSIFECKKQESNNQFRQN